MVRAMTGMLGTCCGVVAGGSYHLPVDPRERSKLLVRAAGAVGVVLLLVAIAATWLYSGVLRDELVAIVTATGEIKPKEYVELQAEISGVITELLVEEGDLVTRGDLLLKIEWVRNSAGIYFPIRSPSMWGLALCFFSVWCRDSPRYRLCFWPLL